MTAKVFSAAKRPVHLGSYPMERLSRGPMPDLGTVAPHPSLTFLRPEAPESIVNAMAEYQAMMDAIRDGLVNRTRATIPADPAERARHMKSFGYFSDASMVGIGPLLPGMLLEAPRRNPDIDRLAEELRTRQTKTLASGIDMIMADLKESMEAPPSTIDGQDTCIVFLYEYFRDPRPDEPGAEWLTDAQAHRAALRAMETAAVIANYIRLLGWNARAHSATSTDIDLNRACVAAGLAVPKGAASPTRFSGTVSAWRR